MNNAKLSLVDFKAKAAKVEISEILEKVQGGAQADCHENPDVKLKSREELKKILFLF